MQPLGASVGPSPPEPSRCPLRLYGHVWRGLRLWEHPGGTGRRLCGLFRLENGLWRRVRPRTPSGAWPPNQTHRPAAPFQAPLEPLPSPPSGAPWGLWDGSAGISGHDLPNFGPIGVHRFLWGSPVCDGKVTPPCGPLNGLCGGLSSLLIKAGSRTTPRVALPSVGDWTQSLHQTHRPAVPFQAPLGRLPRLIPCSSPGQDHLPQRCSPWACGAAQPESARTDCHITPDWGP
jgi:hypothetical protein